MWNVFDDIVNVFISKFPIFKSDLITILILHVLALQFPLYLTQCDSCRSLPAQVTCLQTLGVRGCQLLTHFSLCSTECIHHTSLNLFKDPHWVQRMCSNSLCRSAAAFWMEGLPVRIIVLHHLLPLLHSLPLQLFRLLTHHTLLLCLHAIHPILLLSAACRCRFYA